MTEAIILGGGIAGLGAGLFAQAQGLQLPIYEKQPQLNCDDNLLWLAPNGLSLLQRLGCLEAIESVGRAQDSMIFAARDLRPLMQLRSRGLIEHLGLPILALRRRDLYQILLQRFLEQGGTIHFAHELKQLELKEDHARVHFANGRCESARRVLAADGIGSPARAQAFPESRVHYQGLRTYLGQSRHPVAKNFVGRTLEIWGFGSRFVVTSLDGETAYWSAIERSKAYTPNRDPLPPDLTERLQALYKGFHPDVLTLLDAIVPGSVHRSNFGVVKGLRHYTKGSLTLIGDAAHGMPPNMGQGASLALEDAFWVVAQLQAARDMEGSAQPRLKRAKQMMRLANSMNVAFQPRAAWASQLRDLLAQLMPDRLNERRMVQLYRLPEHLAAL